MLIRERKIKQEINIIKNNIDVIKDILIQKGFHLLINENNNSDILFIINRDDNRYELLMSTLNIIIHTMQLKNITMNIETFKDTYIIRAEDIYSIFN